MTEDLERGADRVGAIEILVASGSAALAVAWAVGPVAIGAVVVLEALAAGPAVRWARGSRDVDRRGDDAVRVGSGMAITAVAVLAGALFVAWYVGDVGLIRTWEAGIAGTLVAAATWALAGRSQAVRHRLLAMGSLLWGFTATVTWGDDVGRSMVVFLGGLAIAFGVVGGWVLLRRSTGDRP